METKQRYDSIQLMRGIAALSVVFVHIAMFNNGAFGVDLFFCISGFIMMYITEKDNRDFLQKRAIRIIPLYWLSTLSISSVLIAAPNVFRTQTFSVEYLIKSLFFIPYDYLGTSGRTVHSLLEVGWTLIYEVFFYILFLISMKINHKNRHIICTVFFICLFTFGFSSKSENEILNYYTNLIIMEFSLGMFAFKLLNYSKKKYKLSYSSTIVLLLSALLIWSSLFTVKYIDIFAGISRLIIFGIPSFVFFVIVFKVFETKKVPRPFVVLGNISYSLYLTHSFVIQGFSRLIYNIDDFTVVGVILVFLVVLPLTIVIAWISWYLVESKFTEFLKTVLLNRSAKT